MGTSSSLAAAQHLASAVDMDAAPTGRVGRSSSVRRLHVIDVENLLGTGRPLPAELAWCERTYRSLGIVGPHDLVVVASNPSIGLDVGRCWLSRRLVVGHGPDGADHALLRVLTQERIDRCFTHVVLASGDGIFADPVAWLQDRHVEVTVVSRATALSARLRLAATGWIEFPPAAPADAAAAAA